MSEINIVAVSAILTAAVALACGTPPAFAALLVIAVVAAAIDAREHRIPNTLSAAAAAAGVLAWAEAGAPLDAFGIALVVAVLLLIAYDWDLMGGGDVKLIPSLALAAAASSPFATGAILRVGVFGVLLFGIAAVWGALHGNKQAPLAVGAPLALALAVVI